MPDADWGEDKSSLWQGDCWGEDPPPHQAGGIARGPQASCAQKGSEGGGQVRGERHRRCTASAFASACSLRWRCLAHVPQSPAACTAAEQLQKDTVHHG
jgi:hypothetical protein